MLILGLDTATEQVGAAVLAADAGAVLAPDAGTVLARATFVGPVAHGERLGPLVAQALREAGAVPRDLAAIAVGRGPGPYTGLRVGLVHAQVLGWALGIPVHGVCSLDALAAEAAPSMAREFLAVTDARRREVYWARYDARGTCLAGPGVGRPADVVGVVAAAAPPGGIPRAGPGGTGSGRSDPRSPDGGAPAADPSLPADGPPNVGEGPLPAVGSGAARYADVFADHRPPLYPDPAVVARLGADLLLRGAPPEIAPLYLRRPDAEEPAPRKRVRP